MKIKFQICRFDRLEHWSTGVVRQKWANRLLSCPNVRTDLSSTLKSDKGSGSPKVKWWPSSRGRSRPKRSKIRSRMSSSRWGPNTTAKLSKFSRRTEIASNRGKYKTRQILKVFKFLNLLFFLMFHYYYYCNSYLLLC